MKKLTGEQIRRMWLDFFQAKGHHIEPGASLVPYQDPTLLWINSGVAALKKYFDGSEIASYRRITNSQKSIRTNDIENVGKTARHHTFFEMLGNFSIGDYFRKEAITWGFELLTSPSYFAIPVEKLYITYHPSDKETRDLWIQLGIDEKHLVPLENNFWEIGEGPCGPNTEIFYDRGEAYDPDGLGERLMFEELDNDRYVEIWNIVFSQFNAEEGKKREEYKELPRKNIDTGAGLERLACVFQGVETNFETDLFYPYIQAVEKTSKYPYLGEYKMAYRVIADHIRTCTFALADGAIFSNEGRGYVLRRLLRRAVRFLRKLEITEAFLYTLVPLVVKNMASYYPYLQEKQEKIMKMIRAEEEKFALTLTSGEMMLRKQLEGANFLSGEDAFKLYDTYGFPFELTEEIVLEAGKTIDRVAFMQAMEAQKERARASRDQTQSMNQQNEAMLNFADSSRFLYSKQPIFSKVIACFHHGERVNTIDDEGDIVFEETNFYATSGGQICDIGSIENEQTAAEVERVETGPHKQHFHSVKVTYGSIHEGDVFALTIDENRRSQIAKNHSAVHLLQSALQKVLGEHVHQEGSYVSDTQLRFDFTHFEKMSEDQLSQIEVLVNQMIAENALGKTEIMTLAEAKTSGAMALFQEKYGDEVRVVSFGSFSKELCGGTHVSSTGEIGCFAITSEASIASGVRRIEAKTSFEAYQLLRKKADLLQKASQLLKTKEEEVSAKISALQEEVMLWKRKEQELQTVRAVSKAKELQDSFQFKGDLGVLFLHLVKEDKTYISSLFDALKIIYPTSIVFIANEEEGKASFVCAVSKPAQTVISAGALIKKVARLTEGSGGGREDVAQGGCKAVHQIDAAFSAVVKELIG